MASYISPRVTQVLWVQISEVPGPRLMPRQPHRSRHPAQNREESASGEVHRIHTPIRTNPSVVIAPVKYPSMKWTKVLIFTTST
jgi:hypothetical protein